MAESREEQLIQSVRWHHRFEILPGLVTPGSYDPGFLLEKMNLPADLSGRRALDLGCSDGFFSLALARRGAEVVSVDYRPKNVNGFGVMEAVTGRSFDYRHMNLFDVTPDQLGTFDIVLFLGVLYHLPDMIRGLSVVQSVCSDTMFLETHCATDLPNTDSLARYHKQASLGFDKTNFWSPNPSCLADMLDDCGFEVELLETWETRCFIRGRAAKSFDRLDKTKIAYGLMQPEDDKRYREARLAREAKARSGDPPPAA
ncbi:MAG TPA: methyltransferase domain-containing protein [Chthoniobacterales bacterium]|nr:methyltransferase domain-containing protein [Chthoniobacterales bacterium]